jgi:hypothetical protein
MFLDAAPPDISSIQTLITNWTHIGQLLVGSIGGLAFVFAFLWKMIAVEPRSVLQAKQWIQRIVVGTIGVELASQLVAVLTGSLSGH